MTAPLASERQASRVALVVHPRRQAALAAAAGGRSPLVSSAARLETRGDEGDPGRVRDLVEAARPDVVLAAGGDGTVSAVAGGLLSVPEAIRPDLALLPLGTANNVARSFGLLPVRRDGARAIELALAAAEGGTTRALDVGIVNGRPFVGSFALGVDAAILARRNSLRRTLRLGDLLGGYPLYLASCALETLLHRARPARVVVDGVPEARPLYNLLVTTCPLYAGEFRFAPIPAPPDGTLQTHWFASTAPYLEAYVLAWRRHLRFEAKGVEEAPAGTRWWSNARIAFETPQPAQLDGEELAPAREWEMRVERAALRLRIPPAMPASSETPRTGR